LLAQETFTGTVRFLFQPAEEVSDDEGISGAARMVEDGAMEGVETVIALHVDDSVPAGDVSLGAGPIYAGVDSFYGTIIGTGGHGAYPHETVDPIHIAGHVVLALHGIVSRRLKPTDPAVISIGSIHGGKVDNVIPERVELTGTIRYLEPAVQELLHAEIERALGIARAMGGDYALRIEIGVRPMSNDAGVVALLKEVAADCLGDGHVRTCEVQMGGEDFGCFSDLAPGAMFMLGCRIEGDERTGHSPRFDIDERCLPIGVAILARAALRPLTAKSEPDNS
jgi:amidohydrolase